LNLVASYVLLSPLLVRLLIDSRILQIYSIKPCSKFLTFSMHLLMIITSCNQYSVKFRPMFLLISAKTNQNFRPCLRFSDVTLFTQHLVLSVAFLARNRQRCVNTYRSPVTTHRPFVFYNLYPFCTVTASL
jgi:hypothetical protein